MALPNPYTPGQVPRVLAGREPEVDLIRGYLARVEAYGELGGPLLVFHAPRGVGKTSLLREGQREAAEHGFVSAWVACARRQPFLPELVNRIGHALEVAEVVTGRDAARWRVRMDRISLQVGAPGVKVTADVAMGTTGPDAAAEAPRPAPIAAVEDLLHESARRVRERYGAGLVVFLDELHAAVRTDAAVLLNALQNLDGARAENPLAVIGAGLPSTPEELTRAATFGERSAFVGLGLLDDPAAQRAVVAPAEELGVAWDPDAVTEVERTAHGYPYFLQLLAHATWEAASPEAGSRVSVGAVRAGMPRATEQLQGMYRARWRAATELEQRFMAAMAQHLVGLTGHESVSRGDVAVAMGRDSRSLSVPRDRLLDKGIIEASGHGRLRFTLPGFADYIRAQTGTD